jgi:uncharacterized protein YlxW (UPF0749 family)
MNPGEILTYTHHRATEAVSAMDALLRTVQAMQRHRYSDAEAAARDLADEVETLRAHLEDCAWLQEDAEDRAEDAHLRAESYAMGYGT